MDQSTGLRPCSWVGAGRGDPVLAPVSSRIVVSIFFLDQIHRRLELERLIECDLGHTVQGIDVAPLSKELKSAGPTSSKKFMKQIRLPVTKCQGEMRMISFIDQPDVIKKFFLFACEHAQAGKT
jgi:hypothetical protein